MKCIVLFIAIYGTLGVPLEDEAFLEFKNGNYKFTAAVYKELLKNRTDNFIVSPLSAEIVLALTNEAARGDTARELITGLSLPGSKEKTQQAIKPFLINLKKDDEDLKLFSANKIYTAQNLVLNDDFKSIATTIYDSGVENVDFEKKNEAASSINDWVEDNTNHRISHLIKEEDIDDDTKIILVNTLYFSGKWISEFKDYATSGKSFFKSKAEVVNVKTMKQVSNFKYYENTALNAKFLELPYKGSDISMTIVLSNEKEGLSSLEENIEQLLAPQPMRREIVDVELPRFTIESQINFIPILRKLGVNHLFDEADLTGLSPNYKNLYVSNVIQKAYINVTETGTEAAAATAVIGNERSAHVLLFDPLIFHVDHPFFYLIKSNGIVLFIGHYVSP